MISSEINFNDIPQISSVNFNFKDLNVFMISSVFECLNIHSELQVLPSCFKEVSANVADEFKFCVVLHVSAGFVSRF